MAIYKNSPPDTFNFLQATGITDMTQIRAVSTLVTDLKYAGIWGKMKAIYPFVGGTATTHKFNLKDPRDADAAYRLFFSGGGTHSANGYQLNGTNAYANTYLIPNNVLSLNTNHISFYSRTNQTAGVVHEIACSDNANELPLINLLLKYTGNIAYWDSADYNITRTSFSNTNSTGFYIGTRTANNINKFFKNNTLQSTNTSTVVQVSLPTKNLIIGAYNFNAGIAGYSAKECAFASIGDGLTDTESLAYYTAVQKFQTSLGRQV